MRIHTSFAALRLALAALILNPVAAQVNWEFYHCIRTSLVGRFKWEVRAFHFNASYIFTTPSHQNSWGYVSFDLFNTATNRTTHCGASSNQLTDFFYGTVQYNCNSTDTSFRFDRPGGNNLRVDQTWMCSERRGDPVYVAISKSNVRRERSKWLTVPSFSLYQFTLSGYGDANLTLGCTEKTWENPSWKIGEIYSSRTIECLPVDITLNSTQVRIESLSITG